MLLTRTRTRTMMMPKKPPLHLLLVLLAFVPGVGSTSTSTSSTGAAMVQAFFFAPPTNNMPVRARYRRSYLDRVHVLSKDPMLSGRAAAGLFVDRRRLPRIGAARALGELHALPAPMPSALEPSLISAPSAGTVTTCTDISSSISNNVNAILLAAAAATGGETESWRQYVPLGVICLVLLDIVLGSPIANLALAPMRRAAEEQDGKVGGSSSSNADGGSGRAMFGGMGGMGIDSMMAGGDDIDARGNRRERVDTAAIAQTTLDKAKGTLELMEYLERNKSDDQRYEDMRKKLDRQDEMLRNKLDSLE